jgi:hypothetical protein
MMLNVADVFGVTVAALTICALRIRQMVKPLLMRVAGFLYVGNRPHDHMALLSALGCGCGCDREDALTFHCEHRTSDVVLPLARGLVVEQSGSTFHARVERSSQLFRVAVILSVQPVLKSHLQSLVRCLFVLLLRHYSLPF